MKKILNLNITFKMLILVIYSLILLALSGIIVGAILSEDETKGYGTSAKDEYISVVARLSETRSVVSEKERATWAISYQIAQQNPNVKIQNVRIFTEGLTQDDKKIYFEGSKKDSSSVKQEVNTNNSYFSTYQSIVKSYSNSTNSNQELKIVYTRVLYQVVENEQTTNKELKYRFVPCKPENENFNNYTNINQTLTYNDSATQLELNDTNKYFQISATLKETGAGTSEKPKKDFLEIKVSANEETISVANLHATNVAVTVFAKVDNQTTDPDNYFSEYITIMDLHGCLVDLNSESWTKDVKTGLTDFYKKSTELSKEYNVSEIYITLTLTTNNGATTTIKNKIALSK